VGDASENRRKGELRELVSEELSLCLGWGEAGSGYLRGFLSYFDRYSYKFWRRRNLGRLYQISVFSLGHVARSCGISGISVSRGSLICDSLNSLTYG
jgi:hypothetical protein